MTETALNLTAFVVLKSVTCSNCGMAFGVSAQYIENILLLQSRAEFYCPAGHSNYFPQVC